MSAVIPRGKKAAVYARVSTSDQSVEQQLSRLRAAAPGAVEYIDEAFSGRTFDRPRFLAMRLAIRNGEIQEVYALKLDRLGRSVKDVLEFYELCDQHQVRVVVVEQGFDTASPVGRMVRTIVAAVAELEVEMIRDRTRAAMAAFKNGTRRTRTGRPPGRPRRMTPEMAQRIRALRETPKPDGSVRTWKEIAQHVHMPAGSCSKVPKAPPAGTPRSENGPSGFGEQMAGSEGLPSSPSGNEGAP
jgi:DNA invertase Pin-like site-specific DNA recombinase